jgi:hypothetical protein
MWNSTKVRRILPWIVTATILGVLLGVIFLFPASLPKQLAPGEVQNYQGENLSAIANVYGNAIAGSNIRSSHLPPNITGGSPNPLQFTYDDVVNNHQATKK